MPTFHFIQHGLFKAGGMIPVTDLIIEGDEFRIRKIGGFGSVFQIVVHDASPAGRHFRT